MPTATKPLPPMPDAPIPIVILPDGRPDPDWYNYLKRLDALVRALRLEIP